MIYKEHLIELFVNGQKMDLESQKSLNLRFNNVLYNPEKISSSQAEYSFEFELPSTPVNDKVFDYANNLSKLNKFRSRWNAEVYADGTLIFSGSLTLNSYKKKKYQCNLVSVKVYSLDDIFGDAVLTDIPWDIPFDGAGTSGYTIDYYNADEKSNVTFPLISYGAFQKGSYYSDTVADDFSSKFDIDKWNRWYVESFYPSLNMLETIKKAFEFKGYSVAGDIFQDVSLKEIFMSTNLANEQVPEYNLGNSKFGKIDLTVNWTNPLDEKMGDYNIQYGTNQELKFPYFKSGFDFWGCSGDDCQYYEPDYNFKEVRLYDMLSAHDGGSVTVNSSASYMFNPSEHLIVIPADGFYKIKLEYNANLLTTNTMQAVQWVHHDENPHPYVCEIGDMVYEEYISFTPTFKVTTPLEIQLVKNYDNNLELIKGKNNLEIIDGYPDHPTVGLTCSTSSNWSNTTSCYPHEWGNPQQVPVITKRNDLTAREGAEYLNYNMGVINPLSTTFCYDPAVSDIFIAGATSMGNMEAGGTAAVIKNGQSWSSSYNGAIESFYNHAGYVGIRDNYNGTTSTTQTDINKNEYNYAPTTYHNQTTNNINGAIYCMVHLKKNDVLQLFGVHRGYYDEDGNSVTYQTSAQVNLSIEAASPRSYTELKNSGYGYNSETEFPVNLKVTNFLNKEKKISEWLQNIVDAFNLEVIQDGKSVFLNTKKKFNRNTPMAIDIDDRVNSADAEAERIDYPKSMAVRYKIDTDEWGFEKSVTPPEKLNDPNWKDFGDSGFTVINLSDDAYETKKSDKSLQFSYTWYDNFHWKPVNSSFQEEIGSGMTLTMPVISKYTYMIDGYDYNESMKHDGYGLAQRFWFRPKVTNAYVWTRTHPVEKVQIYEPSNVWTDGTEYLNLSYKTTEPSLLSKYFNITPYLSSNYVTVEAYLSAEEYKLIKNGCPIHFDNDIYYPVEISGYDPSGHNSTEIKMIKKI